MTRFARAKGSKASNERVPEAASSWSEMKQELLNKKQELEEKKNREAALEKRQANYKAFLVEKEEEESKQVSWASFPEANILHNSINNKRKREIESEESDAEFAALKAKLDNVLDKQSVDVIENGNDSDEEPPEEAIGKEAPKEIVVKKSKKRTKKKMEIVVEQKKVEENLTEKEKRLIEKKKERRSRQLAKRKLRREEKKNGKQEGNAPPEEKKELTEAELQKIQKKKEKMIKQSEKRKKFREDKALEEQNQKQQNGNCLFNNTNVNNGNKKPKKAKVKDNKEHPRRKSKVETMFINGKTVEIDYVDGFPVKKEDAERLRKLRREMISKGLPRSEIDAALKLERRRAEKSFAREKKNVCFKCRRSGHNLSECPELNKDQVIETSGTGICFKCGSTEHTHFECKVVKGLEYKFATCFICQEQGHIAKQCPDNQRGLYPKGGACKVCGDVTHLKKDCPKYQAQQAHLQKNFSIGTLDNLNPDDLEANANVSGGSFSNKSSNKIIKF